MRFFPVSASFSQCAVGDDTVQLLVSISQTVSLVYKTSQVESFVAKKNVNDDGTYKNLTHQNIIKPTCILQYNKHMKGVNRADQYLANSSILRKTLKKISIFPINCTLLDAYKMYCTYLPIKQDTTNFYCKQLENG